MPHMTYVITYPFIMSEREKLKKFSKMSKFSYQSYRCGIFPFFHSLLLLKVVKKKRIERKKRDVRCYTRFTILINPCVVYTQMIRQSKCFIFSLEWMNNGGMTLLHVAIKKPHHVSYSLLKKGENTHYKSHLYVVASCKRCWVYIISCTSTYLAFNVFWLNFLYFESNVCCFSFQYTPVSNLISMMTMWMYTATKTTTSN